MTAWDSANRKRPPPRHLRNRWRRRRHDQHLDGGGHRRRSVRRSGRQTRKPRGDRPRGQLGRAGGARRGALTPNPMFRRRCLAEVSLAFLFAPRYHPGLARLAPVRRSLPFRTVFNLIGPLCNPASPGYQLIGVPDERHAGFWPQALSRQPHIRAGIRRHRQRRAGRDHARRTNDRPPGRAGAGAANPLGTGGFRASPGRRPARSSLRDAPGERPDADPNPPGRGVAGPRLRDRQHGGGA